MHNSAAPIPIRPDACVGVPDDPRVQKLLDEMLESDATPEDVCKTCIELLPVVRTRWKQLRRVREEVEAMFAPSPEPELRPAPFFFADGSPLPKIPGYEVESVLGLGGMGVVFRAKHLRLNRMVALKMALAGAYAGPQERERFQREAEAVALLRHPNVVQIHEFGESDGRPYFTMELVEGGSLAGKLDGKPMPAREAAGLIASLAGAIHAAHQAEIVHRDLKPANILLTADNIPKIGDFGLARRLCGDTGLTRTGAALGTPSYMAPEQARGAADAAAPAVDIYALGSILYELLTGRPPFRAESTAATVHQLLTQDPPPPSRSNARVPRDLEIICEKCLQKEARLRYLTAAELKDDLHNFLQGEAISARPEGRLRRVIRRVRGRPWLSTAVAVATLSTLSLFVGGISMLAERSAAQRAAAADGAATQRAAENDVNEMAKMLKKSSWPEARNALERAKVRLGSLRSDRLLVRIEQGERDLELAARLEKIRMDRAVSNDEPVYRDYQNAFRDAGLGVPGDDPGIVAARVGRSDIKQALIDAFDEWALCANGGYLALHETWLLDVTRKADPDPQGWRDRFRNPIARKSKDELSALADSANIESTPVSLLLALGELLQRRHGNAIPFLMKVQHQYPNDLWANFTLGYYADNPADAMRYTQAALAIRPETDRLYYNLGYAAIWGSRSQEAVGYFHGAVRLNPKNASYRAALASTLLEVGRDREAADQIGQALLLNPDSEAMKSLRSTTRLYLFHQKKWGEARLAWQAVLKTEPADHMQWYGYAELCLFLGQQEEYCRARKALLAKFAATSDPRVAERTARACLLLPISGDDLQLVLHPVECAATADRAKYKPIYAALKFAKGLAEYRRSRFDSAISIMRGDASGVFGPTPSLVLAMALHQSGQVAEARKTLAAAILTYDWRAAAVQDQDGWICNVLRREAEHMILPNLPEFLQGRYQPQDQVERMAFVGACQFTNRSLALSRLYAAAFAADPRMAEDIRLGVRDNAARYAALAGCGRGEDAAATGEPERAHWRAQARKWLREDLTALSKASNDGNVSMRETVRLRLAKWRTDSDLAFLREPAELNKLPPDERKDFISLWDDVETVLRRCQSGS